VRCMLVLCAILLAGCSTPPGSINEEQRFDYRSGKPVPAVAACIRRNADDTGAGMSSQTLADTDGNPEIIVRKTTDNSVVARVSVVPEKGTRVSARIAQYGSSSNSVANALVHNCL